MMAAAPLKMIREAGPRFINWYYQWRMARADAAKRLELERKRIEREKKQLEKELPPVLALLGEGRCQVTLRAARGREPSQDVLVDIAGPRSMLVARLGASETVAEFVTRLFPRASRGGPRLREASRSDCAVTSMRCGRRRSSRPSSPAARRCT